MKRPILIAAIGYILGILEGLYLEQSVVLFLYAVTASIFIMLEIKRCYCKNKILKKNKNGNKSAVWNFKRYIRYIKLYFNSKTLILLIVTSLISCTILNEQEKDYKRLQNLLTRGQK